jgi:N-acetylglucosaminyldiphosphoundecaprenol N-acetyl-beta-D-mannosaminyltransferase
MAIELTDNRITKRIVSLNIDLISYHAALIKVITLAKERTPSYVCFANVHMTIEAYDKPEFSDQVNRATLVLPDGMPLVKCIKWQYQWHQERIAGMDFMPDVIKLAAENKLKIFLFGSTLDVLIEIKTRIEANFIDCVVDYFSPSFERSINDPQYVEEINKSGANIVLVALGCPKQEKWMADNSNLINAVLLGVGGAFPVFAGLTKRAPRAMQITGTEWLYRLMQEPTRLFKRYFKTNIKFLFLLARDVVSTK